MQHARTTLSSIEGMGHHRAAMVPRRFWPGSVLVVDQSFSLNPSARPRGATGCRYQARRCGGGSGVQNDVRPFSRHIRMWQPNGSSTLPAGPVSHPDPNLLVRIVDHPRCCIRHMVRLFQVRRRVQVFVRRIRIQLVTVVRPWSRRRHTEVLVVLQKNLLVRPRNKVTRGQLRHVIRVFPVPPDPRRRRAACGCSLVSSSISFSTCRRRRSRPALARHSVGWK